MRVSRKVYIAPGKYSTYIFMTYLFFESGSCVRQLLFHASSYRIFDSKQGKKSRKCYHIQSRHRVIVLSEDEEVAYVTVCPICPAYYG